jgi:2,4-dienoyl-CoA reductase-like NADH-dependent reductase (Old Yellow Enzyme family)
MSKLLSPFSIRKVSFRNRIVVSPMCMYSAVDGFSNDWHLVHLGSRAVGGAALIIQEATAVSPEGRISAGDLGIWKDEHIVNLKRIVSFIHEQGALAGIQLAHAGRKASFQKPWEGGLQVASTQPQGWKTVAPSAIPFREGTEAPVALDDAGIRKIKDDFREATRRAKAVGYDVVEIHAAHGYLLHEFYSPLTNQRTDAYGGSFENRVRLLLEITEVVKAAWGNDRPLFVRISATDWVPGGWTLEDSVKLAGLLKGLGVDLIDTSSGGNLVQAPIPLTPGYQVNFAAVIKKETGVLTGAVGLITSAEQANNILENGEADVVSFARELLRDPYFALHAAHALGDDISWPIQYERGKIKK